jgi:hypothetical protein
MQNKTRFNTKWLFLLVVPALLIMATGSVLAGRLTDISKGNVSQVNASPLAGAVSAAPVAPVVPDRQVPNPATIDAFALFQPGTGGTCPPPPNGGNVLVGCRFVLNLMINAGSNNGDDPDGGVTAHQTYLTFTNQYIVNARVSLINASCTLTNTLTTDPAYMEALLQNEACNGPGPCPFGGPGTISFSSGTFGATCPNGCPDSNTPDNPFRVAQMGVCAQNPGQAVLHWQFSPPEPQTRDSQIIINNGTLVQNRNLYTDYTFCVGPPGSCQAQPSPTFTDTPVPTNTDTPVPTNTNTPVNTNTNTPVNTNTNTPVNTNTKTPVNTNTKTPVNTNTKTPVNTNTHTTVTNTTKTPINKPTNTPEFTS